MGRPRQRCTGPPGAGPGRGAPPGSPAPPRAREPIFSKRHTNEFRGIGKSTQEPAGPCGPLHPGRWVYEKGTRQAPVGGMSRHRLGTSPRQPSPAAVSPISYIAALAWCPTVCRGTDDCGEHHPSPAAPLALCRGCAASGKTLQAQGNTPCAPRGGLCGCLAVRQTSLKPPGVPTGWGCLRAEPPGRASSWGA